MTSYDSRPDTLAHSRRVGELMLQIIEELADRSTRHDLSKTLPPEVEVFDEYTPKLRDTTYGSAEYKQNLAAMGAALQHHYANNRHHPEFWEPAFEWRPVMGYEGHYEVSNYGDIRSISRIVIRSGTRGDLHKPGQILRLQVTPKGYLRVMLALDGIQRNHMVHRLVAEAYIPNPDGKSEVNHRDGQKNNNSTENLEWVTPGQNQSHAYKIGLRSPNVKYVVHCPELNLTTFGTYAMQQAVREKGYDKVRASGIWAAMDQNRKHWGLTFEGTALADYQRGRVNGMTLADLVEMLADWKAATERHADGNLEASLIIQTERFGLSPQLAEILHNTAAHFGWLS